MPDWTILVPIAMAAFVLGQAFQETVHRLARRHYRERRS